MPSPRLGQLKSLVREFFRKTVLTWNHAVGGLLLKNLSVQLLEKSAEFDDETGDPVVLFRCRSLFFVPAVGPCLGRVREAQPDFVVLSVLNLLDVTVETAAIDQQAFALKGQVT